MGATLVAQAIAHWSHVSDRAFRVLVKMALTAKDKPSKNVPAGLYFGGHDGLVGALPLREGTTRESALRTVRRATDELEEVGAIRLTHAAISGGNAVYQLTLNAVPKPRIRSNSESKGAYKQADTGCPTEADTGCPTGPDNRCPIEADTGCPTYKEPLEEPLKERAEEIAIGVSANVLVIDKSTSAKVPEIPPPRCPEPTCAKGFVLVNDMPARCPQCNSAPDNVIPFGRRTA